MCLLDERLTSTTNATSSLDISTSTQLVRAINKLAIHASTSSQRHVSVQALLSLQMKCCQDNSSLNVRLGKVTTKLFNKVIKDESVLSNPYAAVDIESILCILDDTLVLCNKSCSSNGSFRKAQVEDMILNLVTDIFKSQSSTTALDTMADIGIDPNESCLGIFISSKSLLSSNENISTTRFEDARLHELANLITQISSETDDNQKEKAIDSLRKFSQLFPDIDVSSHLSQVSDQFRTYILEKLEEKKIDTTSLSKVSSDQKNNFSR